MSRIKLVLFALFVAGLSLGMVACGDDSDDSSGGSTSDSGGGGTSLDLTIGDLIPLTGDLADFGPPGQKAADLAVAQINAAIEESGADHTVTIEHEDDQTSDSAGVSAARKLVGDGASCIAGSWASSVSIPVARSVSIREGVLQISPASTSTEITGLEDNGLMNRTPPTDNLQGPALADTVEDALGGAEGKVISVAGRNDSYGDGLTGYFTDAWEAKGGEVTADSPVLYDPEAATYDAEAGQITSEPVDGYVIIDFPETYVKVGPALVRTGKWDPKTTFVTDGLISGTLAEDPKSADYTEGLRGTAPGTPTAGDTAEAFDDLYTSADPKDVKRQTFDSQNFDAVILCYLSAVAAGSTDGQDMADALQDVTAPPGTQYTWEQLPEAIEALQNGDDIDYVGASGDINLDDNGDPTVGVYDVFTFKGGELVPAPKQIPAETAAE